MYLICRLGDPQQVLAVFASEAEARQRLGRHGEEYLPGLGQRPIPVQEMVIIEDPPAPPTEPPRRR